MRNSKLWSGLTALMAVLLVICLIGQSLAVENAGYINNALGIVTGRVVETGEAPGDTTYYKSRFGAFDDPAALERLLAAEYEQNTNEMREGAALLENNGVLPLKDEKRVSVFGHAAVDPAYQASSAGTKVSNTSANVVTLKTALEATLGTEGLDFSQEMLAGERQLNCAKNAVACLEEAKAALESGMTVDAVNVSIDCALNELYALTGQKATEETVNEVFRKFCVGK